MANHLNYMRIFDLRENFELARKEFLEAVKRRLALVEDFASETHLLRARAIHIFGEMYSSV